MSSMKRAESNRTPRSRSTRSSNHVKKSVSSFEHSNKKKVLPPVPLFDSSADTINTSKKRKHKDKTKTPRSSRHESVTVVSAKKAKIVGTPIQKSATFSITPQSARDASKVSVKTPVSTTKFNIDFQPVENPEFLQSETRTFIPQSPRIRASEMIEHAFDNDTECFKVIADSNVCICMSLQLKATFRQQCYHDITHCVMLSKVEPTSNANVIFHHISMDNIVDQSSELKFIEALFSSIAFIEEVAESGGKVAISCRNGRMLSAAIAVAWFMVDKQLSFQDAFTIVAKQKEDIALTKELMVILRFFEWHAVKLAQRITPRNIEQYFYGWRKTADGQFALQASGVASTLTLASAALNPDAINESKEVQKVRDKLSKLESQLEKESQRRAKAEKESQKTRKEIKELKQTTMAIVSDAQQFLDEHNRLEEQTQDVAQLRSDNVKLSQELLAMENQIDEMKHEHMNNLTTLLHETETHSQVIDELQSQLRDKAMQLEEALAKVEILTELCAANNLLVPKTEDSVYGSSSHQIDEEEEDDASFVAVEEAAKRESGWSTYVPEKDSFKKLP